MPRTAGHRSGVRTARKIVEAATRSPAVGTVTLYAFSSDNWSRPTPEVGALMRLLRRSLLIESKRCLENGVRLTIVGRRDRLPAALVVAIQEAEALTAHGRNLHLRVAIDYSARESIMQAATLAHGEPLIARALRASARPGEPRPVRRPRRRSADSHAAASSG